MLRNPRKFAELLNKAINQIHTIENKSKLAIRDELGYAVHRKGRTAIDYWCREPGHIPELDIVETLAIEIVRRKGFTQDELRCFLESAAHPEIGRLYTQCFPVASEKVAFPQKTEVASPPNEHQNQHHNLPLTPMSPTAPIETAQMGIPLSAAHRSFLKQFLIVVPFVFIAAYILRLWWPDSPQPLVLVATSGQRLLVKTDSRTLSSSDTVMTHQAITATFDILNNGFNPEQIAALVVAVRGPGVTCDNKNSEKWEALDNPFPPALHLTLAPGETYRYIGSRALYQPGKYFLEPVFQDVDGQWHGIPPFTCVSIGVTEK